MEILLHFPETKLVLIGAGRDEVALKRQVDNLGIADSVQFRGWLCSEETIKEMATAEVLVVPNTGEEGFGLVVAEGMAANTPIVASRIQVFEEVLGADDSCGWFFDKNNPDSLADAICQVFAQSDEAAARVARASLRVQERFSVERMVGDYLRLYDKISTAD
ncbi:MAG: glycosyltransferase family 4 protein [Pseudomonadota bacterium]